VRLAVELQSAVVGDHGIRRGVGGQDVGIDDQAVGRLPARDDRVNASTDAQQVPRLDVLFHDRQTGARLEPVACLMRGGEVLQAKDWMGCEVVDRFHRSCRFRLQRISIVSVTAINGKFPFRVKR
jgi:hypothetical protein